MPTVHELQTKTLKNSLRNGKKNEQDALAYIEELEEINAELISKLN